MSRQRGRLDLARSGFIGSVLVLLTVLVAVQPDRLLHWASSVHYSALFSEAGGIAAGNDVMISGIKVGSVDDVRLSAGKALVSFTVEAKVPLGSQTTAHVKTGSLLGRRVLVLDSSGPASLHPMDTIPPSRTSSPYSLTDAVSDLTDNTAQTDTQSVNQALDTLADTVNQIAPQLGPTFDGLTRVSQTLNARDDALTQMLSSARQLTEVLSERSQQINLLILNGNDLLGVLVDRRDAIASLLANTAAVSQQLTGLVNDNEKELSPALQRLNSVTAMLEKNRDSLSRALPGLAKYQLTAGETVASGPYYQGIISNLEPAQTLQPFLDYMLGFRRGTDAGQPPDNAGPRSEFPFPHNGIPGGR
jgi:phospholipid/cholesterol/gamma-HCH transport system substrate-binding protein